MFSKTLRAVFQITKNSLTKTFLKFVFLGVQLLYSLALVSPVQQRELAISIYICVPSLSNLSPTPSPLQPSALSQSLECWAKASQVELPMLYINFLLAIYFTHGNAYVDSNILIAFNLSIASVCQMYLISHLFWIFRLFPVFCLQKLCCDQCICSQILVLINDSIYL